MPYEDYQKLSASAQENLCAAPKNKIKELLQNNELSMRKLVIARIEILKRLHREEQLAG